jgi:hypothetical protein
MARLKRLASTLHLLLMAAGTALLFIAVCIPVYTGDGFPQRLADQLSKSPTPNQSEEWYSQLHAHETSHKVLSDWGRGLLSLSISLWLTLQGFRAFGSLPVKYRKITFYVVWVSLWGFRAPASAWYYGLRQSRWDYPIWADSIAIPIATESITWAVGALVTTPLIWLLLLRRELPSQLNWPPARPLGVTAWLRHLFLGLWMLLLVVLIAVGVPDGDEGAVIACGLTLPMLYVVGQAAADPAFLAPKTAADIRPLLDVPGSKSSLG